MGYKIINGYISPDAKHLDAILKMPRPSSKPEVMRLLGLLKYLSRFIPNLSQRSAKLRELTKNTQVNGRGQTSMKKNYKIFYDPLLPNQYFEYMTQRNL